MDGLPSCSRDEKRRNRDGEDKEATLKMGEKEPESEQLQQQHYKKECLTILVVLAERPKRQWPEDEAVSPIEHDLFAEGCHPRAG